MSNSFTNQCLAQIDLWARIRPCLSNLHPVEDAVIGDGGFVDPPGFQQLDLREPGFVSQQCEHLAADLAMTVRSKADQSNDLDNPSDGGPRGRFEGPSSSVSDCRSPTRC